MGTIRPSIWLSSMATTLLILLACIQPFYPLLVILDSPWEVEGPPAVNAKSLILILLDKQPSGVLTIPPHVNDDVISSIIPHWCIWKGIKYGGPEGFAPWIYQIFRERMLDIINFCIILSISYLGLNLQLAYIPMGSAKLQLICFLWLNLSISLTRDGVKLTLKLYSLR